MPTSLGPAEIMVILVVALIVLGPNRLPQAAKQVGKAFAEVRRWSTGIQEEMRDALDTGPDRPKAATAEAPSTAPAPQTTSLPVNVDQPSPSDPEAEPGPERPPAPA